MKEIQDAIDNIKENVNVLQTLGAKDSLPDGFNLLLIAKFPDETEAVGGLVGSGLDIASELAGAMKHSPEFRRLILATADAYRAAGNIKPFSYAHN